MRETLWDLVERYDTPGGDAWQVLAGDDALALQVAQFSARLDCWERVEESLRRLGALS